MDVPVDLYRRAQQHTDALLREVVLMAGYERAGGVDGPASALARRADDHHAWHAALRVEAAPALDLARERGDEHVTLTYAVEGDLVGSSQAWSALLDELGELCGTGALLSVADGDVASFLRWFCTEFVHQLRDGRPPCPWPEYLRQTEGPYAS